jgi:hypothetical protein
LVLRALVIVVARAKDKVALSCGCVAAVDCALALVVAFLVLENTACLCGIIAAVRCAHVSVITDCLGEHAAIFRVALVSSAHLPIAAFHRSQHALSGRWITRGQVAGIAVITFRGRAHALFVETKVRRSALVTVVANAALMHVLAARLFATQIHSAHLSIIAVERNAIAARPRLALLAHRTEIAVVTRRSLVNRSKNTARRFVTAIYGAYFAIVAVVGRVHAHTLAAVTHIII